MKFFDLIFIESNEKATTWCVLVESLHLKASKLDKLLCQIWLKPPFPLRFLDNFVFSHQNWSNFIFCLIFFYLLSSVWHVSTWDVLLNGRNGLMNGSNCFVVFKEKVLWAVFLKHHKGNLTLKMFLQSLKVFIYCSFKEWNVEIVILLVWKQKIC